MRRNGMCIICYVKKLFMPRKRINNIYNTETFDNGVAKTPIMGWSSWNTFHNRIDEKLIFETGEAMKSKGLIDVGYKYLNLDDNWHSSIRDENGEMQGDLSRFPSGIPALVEKLNALGLKVGIYSSNGTNTCEDLPASLGREKQDAKTFARWGIELLKYDYCHNVPVSKYAPLVYAISLYNPSTKEEKYYEAARASLIGNAKRMISEKVEGGYYISGLDNNGGSAIFDVNVSTDDQYVLSVEVKKKGGYNKFLFAVINGVDYYEIEIPPQKFFNVTSRFQVKVRLNAGSNEIKLFNPIKNRADSSFIQYRRMGKCLIEASKLVAREKEIAEKPIVYSICEWGFNRPWQWGDKAGNMWRTTMDIKPYWWWIMCIYGRTVSLYKYAKKGNWNDPDMLEVGNGKLTYEENRSHFSLWCMMSAPLILGNDVRCIPDNILQIVTEKELIAINQDELGIPAKRMKKGKIDVLVKPLTDNRIALLFLNKTKKPASVSFDLNTLKAESYVSFIQKDKYFLKDVWERKEITTTGDLQFELKAHDVKVFVFESK